jgi:FkbM family methyltransferase
MTVAIEALKVAHAWPLGKSVTFRASRLLANHGRPIVQGRIETGSPIWLDVRDPAHREILWSGCIERGVSLVARRAIEPGWAVIDVGANAGFYSLLAADRGATVIAYEPNPRTAALLARSAAHTRVEVVRAACGSTAGATTLYFSPDPGKAGFATVRPEMRWQDDVGAWRGVSVRTVVLDEECEQRELRPQLVKIDAEGAELDVIRGMERLLAARVPEMLLCEVAYGWERPDPSPWIQLLRQSGYEPSAIDERGNLGPLGELREGTIQNVLFRRTSPARG